MPDPDDFLLGDIVIFTNKLPPESFMAKLRPCDGALLPVNQFKPLYGLIGNRFGGNGITNFALPDLRQCIPVGQEFGKPAVRGGNEQTTLRADVPLPAHTHEAKFIPGAVSSSPAAIATSATTSPSANHPNNNFLSTQKTAAVTPVQLQGYAPVASATAGAFLKGIEGDGVGIKGGSVEVSMAGGISRSGPFSTLQPFFTVRYYICVQGVYPSKD